MNSRQQASMGRPSRFTGRVRYAFLLGVLIVASCASADVPGPRDVDIPNPTFADKRPSAVNERPDSVMYLPLGRDVLMPEVASDDSLPKAQVGPFELRGETLAGALQLILADYNVPLAFEADEGLTTPITVANLRGPLNKVVETVCGLASLYCAYENGILNVKKTQTFTVKIPPISQDTSFMQNVATGLQAITQTTPIVDQSTRTIIYTASQRTADMALRYFQRMRSSTALIIFETYIWEVSLNTGNSTGVNWDMLQHFGKFSSNVAVSGSVNGTDFTNPISIGLPTTKGLTSTDVFKFLSTFGAVKTISQPQITVLSGSQASLRAADRTNFVSNISETLDNGQATTSVSTDSVDTGFTLTIKSAWDNASVYADINISLTDVLGIENFAFQATAGGSTTIQLPKTTEREVATQVRVRPGDSLLIAGLVREADNYDSSGPGLMKPILPASRTVEAKNLELVFLMRPRVVVYTNPDDTTHYNEVRDLPPQQDAPLPAATQTTPSIPLAKNVSVPVQAGPPEKVTPIPVVQSSEAPLAAPASSLDPAQDNSSLSIVPVSAMPIAPGTVSSAAPVAAPQPAPAAAQQPPVSSIPTDLLDPSFSAPSSQTTQYR